MATAQELLSSIAGPEEHIVIGADRFITVPKPLQRIAVQFDHDVETVTFDCPRYWDDLDMSKMVIYINYKLPDGTLDAYPTKNIKVDGDIMHFDWTISRNLTQYKGTITFLVCIKKTGTDGVEVNHWNSELCTDMYVSEGMECQEQAQMEYSDLITQLLERMTVVENINVQAEEMQALHDETLEAAALAKDESNYIKNSYANAYKQSVSGEVIRVDDVSPLEHVADVCVHGKNLFDISKIAITTSPVNAVISEVGEDYIIVTTEDGYTGNGFSTTTQQLKEICPGLEIGKTYVLSAITESNSTNIYFSGIGKSWVFGKAMVVTEELLNSPLTFYGLSTMHGYGTGDCRISNIQIEEGETATEYTPYVDPSTVTLTKCGKNLFNRDASVRNLDDCKSWGQRVLSVSEVKKIFKPNVKYVLSFEAEGLDNLTYDKLFATDIGFAFYSYTHGMMTGSFLHVSKKEENWLTAGKKITHVGRVTIPADFQSKDYELFGYTQRALDADGVAFLNRVKFNYIQVEIAEEKTDYEEYKGESYTPNSDGTVSDVTSLSPTMILIADNTMTIDLTYNRDNNKVIGDISTALDALLSMQEDTIELLDSMSGGTS